MTIFSPFKTYILRTPILPVSFYTTLLEKYSKQFLFETVENTVVKNAIRLASPELIQELDKYNQNPSAYDKEKARALELSLLKYVARMASRATPFGLFAGCTTGSLDEATKIQLKETSTTHTQFDMQFWSALLRKLTQNKSFQKELLYVPNTSLYSVGSFYRYIEYKVVDSKREHSIASVRKSPFLEQILERSKEGAKINDLAFLIMDSESEKEEALAFIEELIANQILVSNLESTITGRDEVKRVLKILENNLIVAKEYAILNEIICLINTLNQANDFSTSNMTFILERIKELDLVFEEKHLLQTDLYTQTAINTLDKNIVKKLSKAITFLGNIQDVSSNQNLEDFKNAFHKRYESKELPLSVVLDTEIGISYPQDSGMNDSNPILDQFSIPNNNPTKKKEFWSKMDYMLEKKLQKCIATKESSINLNEKDFLYKESNKRNFPPTFSAMVEVIKQQDNTIVVLDSLGNFSATKFIGRFCNGSKAINQLADEIVKKEADFYSDSILAEIAHIPESRTGNILRRPVIRPFEIPYLANSILPKKQQIELDDIMVSIKNNRVFLRSKKLNKEIIPCLSNAHNYSGNALPLYQFLCDLQGQKSNPVHKFDWGILNNHYDYFPRVLFQDVILAKAKWILFEDELETILSLIEFESWRNKKQIPKYVSIVSGDNTLLLDLEKEICFKLLKQTIKSKYKITIEEFLFSENSVVQDAKNNHFVNQFIISFYTTN